MNPNEHSWKSYYSLLLNVFAIRFIISSVENIWKTF